MVITIKELLSWKDDEERKKKRRKEEREMYSYHSTLIQMEQ